MKPYPKYKVILGLTFYPATALCILGLCCLPYYYLVYSSLNFWGALCITLGLPALAQLIFGPTALALSLICCYLELYRTHANVLSIALLNGVLAVLTWVFLSSGIVGFFENWGGLALITFCIAFITTYILGYFVLPNFKDSSNEHSAAE